MYDKSSMLIYFSSERIENLQILAKRKLISRQLSWNLFIIEHIQ